MSGVSRKNCSRIKRGGGGIDILRAPAAIGLDAGVALIDFEDRLVEAAAQGGGELAARRPSWRAAAPSGWRGTPTTRACGSHSCQQSLDEREDLPCPCSLQGASAVRALPSQAVAAGHADAAQAEIEAQRQLWTCCAGIKRAPLLGTEHARVDAQQAPAHLLVALVDGRVEDQIGIGIDVQPAVAPDLLFELPRAPSRCSPG